MLSLLAGLVDPSGFTPHGFCLSWEPGLIWLDAISDALTALAYYAIPFTLIAYTRRRRGMSPIARSVMWLFAAFILACATTHVLDALTLWFPLYWLQGIAKAVTAAASVGTAVVLWPLMMRMAKLATPEAMERAETAAERAETAVERLTVEREDAQAALRHSEEMLRQAEKLTALGQLAGGIAHDFNNVLQAIQGAASLLQRHAGDEAFVQRMGHMIDAAVGRGNSVTRRLLAFARRDALHATSIAPAPLLEGLAEFLRHTLGSHVALSVIVAPGTPEMMADRGQIETALVNLATNARDAMPNGGTLTFLAEPVTKDATNPYGLAPGDYVRLSVTDSGEGMEPDVLARAAEPFFTTKPQGKGTGLGLAMARGFAEQSGGTLRIQSAPGAGTTITMWLPATTPIDRSRDCLPPPPSRPDGRTARVLLVDDEDLVREVLRTQLTECGFAVTVANDADGALTMLMADHYDLLLTDFSMPGMNGLTLIQAAKAREPGLPAILLTGYVTETAPPAPASPRGASITLPPEGEVRDGFCLLRKPVPPEQLAALVGTMLAPAEAEG